MSGSGAQRMGKRLPWWAGPHPGVSVDAKVHTLAIEAAAGAAGRVGLELRETSERTCAGGHSLRTVGVKPVGGGWPGLGHGHKPGRRMQGSGQRWVGASTPAP